MCDYLLIVDLDLRIAQVTVGAHLKTGKRSAVIRLDVVGYSVWWEISTLMSTIYLPSHTFKLPNRTKTTYNLQKSIQTKMSYIKNDALEERDQQGDFSPTLDEDAADLVCSSAP